MFERYTERARRVVFFARYDASVLGKTEIEPVCLLLGLFREDALLRELISEDAREQIRQRVEQEHRGTGQVATTVDMPLSHVSRRALALAAEEAEAMRSQPIDSGHLFLGVLRAAPDPVEDLVRDRGVSYDSYRESMARRGPVRAERPRGIPYVPQAEGYLSEITEIVADRPMSRFPGTRKEALGHLIDWATALHQWIGRAIVEKKVVGHGYPAKGQAAAEKYGEMRWMDLAAAWGAVSGLLSQIQRRLAPEILEAPCRIGVEDPVPLSAVIARYEDMTKDLLAQICALGE